MALIGIGSLPSTERSRPLSISSLQGRRKALQHRLLGPSSARSPWARNQGGNLGAAPQHGWRGACRGDGGEPAAFRAGGGQSGKASDLLPSLVRALRSITHGNTTVRPEVFPRTLIRALSGARAGDTKPASSWGQGSLHPSGSGHPGRGGGMGWATGIEPY